MSTCNQCVTDPITDPIHLKTETVNEHTCKNINEISTFSIYPMYRSARVSLYTKQDNRCVSAKVSAHNSEVLHRIMKSKAWSDSSDSRKIIDMMKNYGIRLTSGLTSAQNFENFQKFKRSKLTVLTVSKHSCIILLY